MTQRLYPTIQPLRYKISLAPDLEKFTFTGEETVLFKIEKDTNTITLHAAELTLEKVILKEGENEYKGTVLYNEEEETVTITFDHILTVGEHALSIEFHGVLSERMRGFYRSQYEVNGEKRYMATTQFEEAEARRAFPCIDEPSAKAIFETTLVVPTHVTAVSNTVVQEEVVEGELKRVSFTPTPKMSTYILAFIVGELEYVESHTKEGVQVRVFTTPGKKDQARFALSVATKVLSFYQNYFAIEYPLPILDLIAIPDFDAGAMENWGAVTFREAALLIDEQHSSLANKQWVALVIAHELAHMWFGNLVTMEWWTYLWLNESFATYIEYVAINELYPQWDLWNQFIVVEHNDALQLDSLVNTHPIEVPIRDMDELKEIFDEISYAKGASVLHMLASYLGKEVFRDGLRVYLKKHAFGNAVTEDLWEAFEEVSNEPIGQMMQSWTKKPGYPILKVDREDTALQLSQQRFYSSRISQQNEKDTTTWEIPSTIKTPEHEEKFLMKGNSLTLPLNPLPWAKINAGEATVIRVMYPEALYEGLKEAVQSGELPEIDRMGILRDAFDAAKAGLLSTTAALSLAKAYTLDDAYTVWANLTGNIAEVGNILSHKEGTASLYNPFAKALFSKIADKVGWEKKEGESHTQSLLRGIVLRAYAKYGDEKTIATAKELFEKSLAGGFLDPDIRSVVYNTVAQYGGNDIFLKLKEKYEKEPLHQEKNRIGLAMTVFEDETILQQVLDWCFSGAVRSQDTPRFILAMFGNPKGQHLAWNFVKVHWEEFVTRYEGQHSFTRLIDGAGEMASLKAAKDIEQFFADHPTPTLSRTIQQALERIYANVEWLEKGGEAASAFLENEKR